MTHQQNLPKYEHLLSQILQPDTQAVREAVQELNKLLKHPSSIQNLAHILFNSPIEGVRQLAAVLMRKRLVGHWGKLPEDFQAQFREALIQRVVVEPSSLVRKSIGELIGLLGRLLVPMNLWPSLLPFLFQLTQSAQAEHREIAMRLFCSLSEHIPDQLKPHLNLIHNLFIAGLKDPAPPVALATLKGIGAFLELLENETALIEALFPPMKAVLEFCISNHLIDSVYAALETLDGLVELHYLPDRCAIEVLNMILTIGNNSTLDRELRRRALTLIDTFVVQASKLVTDYNLVSGIVSVLFAMGSEPGDSEEEEDDDPTEVPNWKFVGQLLDSLSSSVPTKFVYQPTMHLVSVYLSNEDPYKRRMALVALSGLVEGCVLVIEENIEEHLKLIFPGFKDPSPLVREQASLALALFSRYLQPDIGKYHSQILPLLFEALNDPVRQVRNQTCFALETFVEHLDADILPYLDELMQRMMTLLQTSPPNVQANIISVLSAAATAAGTLFEPYFSGVLRYLEPFLSITDENHMALRGSATECVGIIISALKEKCPKDVITGMMQIAIRGFEIDNPELREYTFFFLANVAPIMSRELTPYLPTIIPRIWETCESDDGIIEKEKQQEIEGLEEDSDDDGDIDMSVRTSFIDEKSAATRALGDIAKATSVDFSPYVEKTRSVLEFLIGYFHADVREAAIAAFQNLIISVHSTFPTQPWTRNEVRPLHPTTQELVDSVMGMYLNILTQEEDKEVVTACCSSIVELIKLFGPDLCSKYIQPLTEAVHQLLTKQAICFQVVEEYDDDEEEGDLVLTLFDCCCEIIVESSKVLNSEMFLSHFRNIYSSFTKYLKPSVPASYQAAFIGALADITKEIQFAVAPYAKQLLAFALKGMSHRNQILRRNSTYASGLFIQFGGQETAPMTSAMLGALEGVLSDVEPAIIDNALGALSRLIFSSPFAIPPNFPVVRLILSKLPLREDFEPYTPILSALCRLVRDRSPLVGEELGGVLTIAVTLLGEKAVEQPVQNELHATIKDISGLLSSNLPSVVNTWAQPLQAKLHQALQQ